MDKNIETYVNQIVSKLDCRKEEKYDIAEEMKGHLYLLKNDYLIKGLTNEEATQKALQDFGNENSIKAGLQNSMFPNYKVFRLGLWVLFGMYSFIMLSTLLVGRICLKLIHGYFYISSFRFSHEELSTLEVWRLNSNLMPFRQISEYIFRSYLFNTDIIIRNLVGSIIIFIPLGIFLPILFKNYRKISSVIVATILSSFAIQFLQLVFQVGNFDVDKIILHTMGSISGYMILKFVLKILNLKDGMFSRKMVE